MELNILLLPLLGGYAFYRKFNGTAYHAVRCSSQRLIFSSAISGLILLLLARFAYVSTELLSANPREYSPYVGAAIGGLAVTTCCTLLCLAWSYLLNADVRNKTGRSKAAVGIAIGMMLAFFVLMLVHSVPPDPYKAMTMIAVSAGLCLTPIFLISAWLTHINNVPIHNLMFRLSLAFFLTACLAVAVVSYFSEMKEYWGRFSPYDSSGTALTACLLGLVAWKPLNKLLLPYSAAIDRLYKHDHISALEQLLYESMLEVSQIQVTLDDGKIYIGWPVHISARLSESDTYLQILPLSSGYRDERTKQVEITTHYDEVYDRLSTALDPAELDFVPEDFIKVVPISRIVVVGKFHPNVYTIFNSSKANETETSSGICDDDIYDRSG